MKNILKFSIPVFRPNLYYDVWFLEVLDKPFDHLKNFIVEALGPLNDSLPKVIKMILISFFFPFFTNLFYVILINNIYRRREIVVLFIVEKKKRRKL